MVLLACTAEKSAWVLSSEHIACKVLLQPKLMIKLAAGRHQTCPLLDIFVVWQQRAGLFRSRTSP